MSCEPIVGAISDIHSPKFLEDFKKVLNNRPDVDLMLLAGDMIYKGRVEEYHNVIDIIKKRYGECRIVACFGNEEYDDKIHYIVERFSEIVWLNDSYITIELRGLKVSIIGTKGCLDRPTTWQRKNIPNINQVYEERLRKIDELLADAASKKPDIIILLSHYSTTSKTLIGEPRWAWPELGSSKLEDIIKRRKPNVVIHGHAHNSKIYIATIDGTQVYNVSFPATRKLTIIRLQKGGEKLEKQQKQMMLTSFMRGKP